jgi:capsular exopolysaccharide synthesis family protein
MRDQSHQLEQIITNAETSIQDLEAKLVALGSAPQQSTTEGAPSMLDQQNLIVKQLTDERGRLSDALRTLATIYQVLLDTNTNQLQIIEPAGAVFPVNQNLSLRVTAAALAALLLVMSIVFAYEYFDDTIRVPGDFTRAVRVPLLSTIEKHDRLDNSGRRRVVTSAQPTSQAANSYRTAVAKLLFSIGKSLPYTYLLSSVGSQSEDDTAMTTANLGVAFAQAGNRVVLVDAQFHNPVLTKLFEANGKVGLSDLLENKSSQLQLMPVKDMPNVQLLPAGMSSEKWPGAMLNSANVARLVQELQQVADIVLVAGPPISGFAESLALASHVNGVILTARYGETHSKVINDVIESLSGINVQLAGVIFEQNPSPSPKSKAPKASGPIEKSNIPEQISK